jgi:glycosyltransferase involved in cell wall biosynthesis
MIKIIYLTREMQGGMKKHLYLLLEKIDKNKFHPILIGNQKSCEEFKVEKIFLPVKEKILPREDFLVLKKIIEIVKKEKINLIHCHGYKTAYLGAIVNLFLKIPVILTIHNYLFYGNKKFEKKLQKKIFKIISRYFSKIITVSNDLKKYLENMGIDSKKIKTIYNGIEIENENTKRIEKNYKIAGVISRFVPQKGIIYFIKCIPVVLKEIKNVKFLIIGEGPEKENLIKEIKELNIENFVEILPYQKNISSFLKSFDLLVVPSISEGAGIIILEAMANKLPVVATRVGGIPEIVKHNETGILVEPANIGELSSAIIKLLKEEKLAEKMGESAREIVKEKFDINLMIKETEKLYEDVLNENL